MGEYPRPATPGRAANMRAIRRVNTKPETALRSALHRRGYRFRKDHRLDLAGGARVRPDIAFTARKVAVFVDGCFWHCCPQHGRPPTANEWYWGPKLRRNVERDLAADAALAAAGWRVVRIWEHVPVSEAADAVIEALRADERDAAGGIAAGGEMGGSGEGGGSAGGSGAGGSAGGSAGSRWPAAEGDVGESRGPEWQTETTGEG